MFNVGRTQARGGTRIPCQLAITLTSLDLHRPFSETCHVVVVNMQGCAVRTHRTLEVGTAVRLQGLPAATSSVTGRVVNSISFGEQEKLWLLGLALDERGNVWGVQTPPQDWSTE
jgi:hypothetical protein